MLFQMISIIVYSNVLYCCKGKPFFRLQSLVTVNICSLYTIQYNETLRLSVKSTKRSRLERKVHVHFLQTRVNQSISCRIFSINHAFPYEYNFIFSINLLSHVQLRDRGNGGGVCCSRTTTNFSLCFANISQTLCRLVLQTLRQSISNLIGLLTAYLIANI